MKTTIEVTSEVERKLNIEIPFPQTDLHVRSIDGSAAAALNSPAPERAPAVSAE